jgi:hypothetical protein
MAPTASTNRRFVASASRGRVARDFRSRRTFEARAPLGVDNVHDHMSPEGDLSSAFLFRTLAESAFQRVVDRAAAVNAVRSPTDLSVHQLRAQERQPRLVATSELLTLGTVIAFRSAMTMRSVARHPRRSFVLPLAALLCSTAAGLGCGSDSFKCPTPLQDVQVVTCALGGSVRVAVSGDFALPATVGPIEGSSCLQPDGTCTNTPTFSFQSKEQADGHYLSFSAQLLPTDGPGSYPLPANVFPNVSGEIHSADYGSALQVVSGTLVVARSDRDGLQASFDMELDTEDGQHHVSLTAGEIDIAGCHVETVKTCVLN